MTSRTSREPAEGEDEFAAYQGLSEEAEDHRWAFGTGFTDPLEGIDSSVPAGVDAAALAAYCLMLGDDALIYSHRLQQWMTRMPELEEETALANIALDLLGQARMLLARAGQAEGAALSGTERGRTGAGGTGRSEDQLAFFRDEHEFRNVRLAEHADADFAELAGRLLVFSAWRLALCTRLAGSADPVLAAIAAKSARELAYHRDYAAEWVIRLGDGTPLSHGKMQAALDAIWPLADELFQPDPVTARLPGVAADPAGLRDEVDAVLGTVLAEATLKRPGAAPMARVAGQAGRDGVHTEAFGYLLAELQSLARAHPDATW
jgi:ring-1,2-phenylacetyl-CoA epoxidase subunit PaaC